MARWTNGQSYTVTEKDCNANWSCRKPNEKAPWCNLCGYTFSPGEIMRFVYLNGGQLPGSGNIIVCQDCDTPDVIDKRKAQMEIARIFNR